MSRVFLSFVVLLAAALTLDCGSGSALEGVSIGTIEFEGEHAADVKADLEAALQSAGATLNAAGAPKLQGTLTWEWAGEGAEPYPTLVNVFIQSDPKDQKWTISAQYQVPEGAQPQNVAHYRGQIVDRIVSRIVAQAGPAS